MVKGKKRFEFLTFDVDVVLRDDVPELFDKHCDGGIYNKVDEQGGTTGIAIWFKGLPSMEIVTHECYHLFMRILEFIDGQAYTFKEMNSEIYAYQFGELCQTVLDKLRSLPYYHELLDDMQKEETT